MSTAGQQVALAKNGRKVVKQVADPVQVQSHYREHDWNTMEIIARGSKLIQKVNGVEFCTVSDRDAEMSRSKGFIALQDHGKGCKVAFRKIQLKVLP